MEREEILEWSEYPPNCRDTSADFQEEEKLFPRKQSKLVKKIRWNKIFIEPHLVYKAVLILGQDPKILSGMALSFIA